MSMKRWDIELSFLSGLLSTKGPIWYQGPIIRIGKRPGPGGVDLKAYQAIAEVHVTIQAYDGNRVALSPIAPHVVRGAEHENVNWSQVHPLRSTAYLTDGNVIHVGPLERGCRFKFLQCKSFEWRQSQIISNVDQSNDDFIQNEITTTRIKSNTPKWFYPSLLVMTLVFCAVLVQVILQTLKPLPPAGIRYEEVPKQTLAVYKEDLGQIEEVLLEGFKKPFAEFVMVHNARVAERPELTDQTQLWDQKFYERTVAMMKSLSHYKGYWKNLSVIKEDYASVITALRKERFPEVFAGVPMQETRFRRGLTSPVCASGVWQFMPETAKRVGIAISDCKLKGVSSLWTPRLLSPPYASKSAYVRRTGGGGYSCRIARGAKYPGQCGTDERFDLPKSTEGAVKLFKETWDDPELRESGSIVQMAIIAHNCGYDDAKFNPDLKKPKSTNVLPSYRQYMRKKSPPDGSKYYGDNILCGKDKDPHVGAFYSVKCGGFIANQSQHYGYRVVAKHLIAVCFYAKNHGNEPVFSAWKKYLSADGYCKILNTPTLQELGLNK